MQNELKRLNYLSELYISPYPAGDRSAQGTAQWQTALTTPDLSRENAWYRQTLAELLDLLAKSKLRPLVSARVPLADAAHAHQLLESGKYRGKVVLVTGAYTEYLNGDGRARAAFKRARPASST